MRSDRRQQGYSLVEMLVVLAIIGLMSVITVPQFINYQQSLKLRGALRVLTGDLINARQLAITRYWQVRVEFATTTTYKFYYRSGNSGSWIALTQTALGASRINGVIGNTKTVESPLTFAQGPVTVSGTTYAAMNDLSNPANALPDIIFNWDGSAQLSTDNTQGNACIALVSPRTKLPQNEMVSIIYSTGKISSVATHS
jgi:type IV pilus assembly protein PilA